MEKSLIRKKIPIGRSSSQKQHRICTSICLMEKLPGKNENSYWSFRQPIAAQDFYYLPDREVP